MSQLGASTRPVSRSIDQIFWGAVAGCRLRSRLSDDRTFCASRAYLGKATAHLECRLLRGCAMKLWISPLTETTVTCNVRFTMTRAGRPDTRAKLLEGTVDYILKRGLTELTLRPLAAALKTSPRMLLYFFGSKEQLITEALAQSRARQQGDFVRMLSAKPDRRQQLALAWEVWSSRESERSSWLFFEAYSLAMRNRHRFPGFVERLVKDWLPFFEHAVATAGVEPDRVSSLATFILATIRGLQLDLLATNDRARIDGAFRAMLELLALQRQPVPGRVRKRRMAAKRA